MSMFSFPHNLSADEMKKSVDAMSGWVNAAEFDKAPMMVNPVEAFAAATALSFGIAGHMAGLMVGAMLLPARMMGAALDLDVAKAPVTPQLKTAPAARLSAAKANEVAVTPTAEIVPIKRAEIRAEQKAAAPAEGLSEIAATPASAEAPVVAKADLAKPVSMVIGKQKTSAAKPAPKSAKPSIVDQLKTDAHVAAQAAVETTVVETAASPASKVVPVEAVAAAAQAKATPVAAVPALEPEDFRRPAEMEKPEMPDDLKRISGVGPKLEQVLNGLGVWTYGQIAVWGPEEVAWVDDYLQFKGRIDRDDWSSQAGALAKGAAKE